MIPRIPADPARRAQRKADLLLASQVLRGQILLDVEDVGGRADVWGRRWQSVRGWLSDPRLLATMGGAGAFMFAAGGRWRAKLWRMARWAWLGWRMLRRR